MHGYFRNIYVDEPRTLLPLLMKFSRDILSTVSFYVTYPFGVFAFDVINFIGLVEGRCSRRVNVMNEANMELALRKTTNTRLIKLNI